MWLAAVFFAELRLCVLRDVLRFRLDVDFLAGEDFFAGLEERVDELVRFLVPAKKDSPSFCYIPSRFDENKRTNHLRLSKSEISDCDKGRKGSKHIACLSLWERCLRSRRRGRSGGRSIKIKRKEKHNIVALSVTAYAVPAPPKEEPSV